MVPDTFQEFFLASVGAAGAFVGLLFVAISVAPEQIAQEALPIERRALAANAFFALLNAFFISMIALMPGASIGPASITLGALGDAASLSLVWELIHHKGHRRRLFYQIGLLLGGLLLYGAELDYGIKLTHDPGAVQYVHSIATLLLGLYALGIARAWQLVGGRGSLLRGRVLRSSIGGLEGPGAQPNKAEKNKEPDAAE